MNAPEHDPGPSAEHRLVGIDGGNPLAFLAALGTLRSLTSAWPDRRVRMSWFPAGPWRPVLHVDPPATQDALIGALDVQLKRMCGHPIWSLGPDLTVSPETFRGQCTRPAARMAHDRVSPDRTWADFAAAFGCEATTTEGGLIQDTALRTMSGAGHQHFLQFMALIAERTGRDHLEKALFRPWRYDDPVRNQSLRWDPADDVRRALRWRDPSGDPRRERRGGMLGANRLAIEALPLLPTIPVRGTLRTTGFSTRKGEGTNWTWPIWSGPLPLDVVRSALALVGLQPRPEDTAPRPPGIVEVYRARRLRGDNDQAERLRQLGIVEVYRARRLTIGKFRGFAPAQPI